MESVGTGIVVLIIIVAIFFALKSATRHFKGQGGCCGGKDPDVRMPKKKLEGKKLGEFTLQVEGMTCKHCREKVEEAVNEIEGAVCKVNLAGKTATVAYDRQIDRAGVIEKIRAAGYKASEKMP